MAQSVTGSYTTLTSDTITVSASDSGSGVASVAIYDGTTSLGAATLTSGAWTYTATSLTTGVHTFTAVAKDNVGNTSTSTLSVADQVGKPTPALAVVQSAPAGWNAGTSDTITVNASETGGYVKFRSRSPTMGRPISAPRR